ncbi:transposase, partial [Pseudomonas aeruginosa]
MPRLLLNDEHWSKLREILLHKAIYNKRDLRMTVEGMLYRMRTGCPWRDLPKEFGNWNKVYKRFNAWSAAGKWFVVARQREVAFRDALMDTRCARRTLRARRGLSGCMHFAPGWRVTAIVRPVVVRAGRLGVAPPPAQGRCWRSGILFSWASASTASRALPRKPCDHSRPRAPGNEARSTSLLVDRAFFVSGNTEKCVEHCPSACCSPPTAPTAG